jgi:nucleoside-diphosphate-sugar epimerase
VELVSGLTPRGTRVAVPENHLTVAVTGPTGTFGFGLLPLLQADDRVARVVGIARHPFDPAAHGWTKMHYRRGDVRDPDALRDAFRDVDVVVHLAFLITGTASPETIRAVNVEGTLNAFRAAATAGARRFVYASSVAAYGFHPDNPVGMTEEWPVRPAKRLFYAQEKAELEHLLQTEAAGHHGLALYLLRPSIVLGPHTVGAKGLLPGPLAPLGRLLAGRVGRLPVPALVPALPVQFVHEEDVGHAFLQCVVAAGPPGAYNIAADGIVTAVDVARELGVLPLPLPAGPAQAAARALAALPFLPPVAGWVEAASHPAIMDTTRAKQKLGWAPRFTALEALQDTLRRRLAPDPSSP